MLHRKPLKSYVPNPQETLSVTPASYTNTDTTKADENTRHQEKSTTTGKLTHPRKLKAETRENRQNWGISLSKVRSRKIVKPNRKTSTCKKNKECDRGRQPRPEDQ